MKGKTQKKIIVWNFILLISLILFSIFLRRLRILESDDLSIKIGISLIVLVNLIIGFRFRKLLSIPITFSSIVLYIALFHIIYIFFDWPLVYGKNISMKCHYKSYEWEKVSCKEVNIDSNKIESALNKATNIDDLRCLLLVKNDKLLIENYYHGAKKDEAYAIHSATKSITSILIGLAIKNKLIENIDKTVLSYFPEYQNSNSNWTNVTLKHLLTMSSGVNFGSSDKHNTTRGINWIDKTLDYELLNEPGTNFYYSDGNYHLLSGIIQNLTGQTIKEYAKKELFEPLDINIRCWETSPKGLNQGATGIWIIPTDFARIGQLYLNQGNINNVQLIDTAWINTSLKPHFKLDDLESFECVNPVGYGLGWWLTEIGDYNAFMALGYGEQMLVVIPELNLIIVTIFNWNINNDKMLENRMMILNVICDLISANEKIRE